MTSAAWVSENFGLFLFFSVKVPMIMTHLTIFSVENLHELSLDWPKIKFIV